MGSAFAVKEGAARGNRDEEKEELVSDSTDAQVESHG